MTPPTLPAAPVSEHYHQAGLEARLLQALQRAGHDLDNLPPGALAGAEHFHLAGAVATHAIVERLALGPQARVLDVGCGIGGPARCIAQATGCHVTGVDVTAAFVASATALSRRVGLAERTTFRVADALALPFEDGSFDAVVLLHVGMNIKDKAKLIAELARVARVGARVVVYDIMRLAAGALTFPLPWASSPAHSFLATQDMYQGAFDKRGLHVEGVTDRSAMVLALVAKMRAAPPPIGLRDLMGPEWPTMFGHVVTALEAGFIAPIEMVARR